MTIKASFTVEASLIFPIIALVLIAILYIAIYVHEMVCLQGIANKVTSEAHSMKSDSGSFDDQITEKITALADQNLIIKKGTVTVDCQINRGIFSDKVEIEITKEFLTPFKLLNRYMDHDIASLIEIRVISCSKLMKPTDTVRTIDFIDDVTSDLIVLKAFKQQFRDLVEQLGETIHEWV